MDVDEHDLSIGRNGKKVFQNKKIEDNEY